MDHSGAIDKNEMKNVMKSIYAMVGNVPTKKHQQKDNMGLDEKVMLGRLQAQTLPDTTPPKGTFE